MSRARSPGPWLVSLLALASCRSRPSCPEPFVAFPRKFNALQKVILPDFKLPFGVALAKTDRDGGNWDVVFMEPLLQTPFLTFRKRGFEVTHETPLRLADGAENLDKAFLALRYFYDLDDFVCGGQVLTRELRGASFLLANFKGEGRCRFPYRIDVKLPDGTSFALETVTLSCAER